MSESHEYQSGYGPDPSTPGNPEAAPRAGDPRGQWPPAGPPPATAPPTGLKAPGWAAFLSALIPGLGNIYVGYYQRGFVQALVFAGVIALLASRDFQDLAPFLGIFLGFWWFFGIIDAYRRAALYNQFVQGHQLQQELPRDLELPSQGSVPWGVVLVFLGLVLFLHTRFDFSLSWMEDWWPLLLVYFGGWLIYKARRGRDHGQSERHGEE